MEPPETATDPPDIYQDDYWRWSMYRAPKLASVLDIDELAKTLQQQADQEYAARERQRDPADIEAEAERAEKLRGLVLRALATEDPEDWAQVDMAVAGRGQR